MTPVDRRKLYAKDRIHNGNCYAACLALVACIFPVVVWGLPGRVAWALSRAMGYIAGWRPRGSPFAIGW